MLGAVRDQLDDEGESLRRGCLFKEERVIDSPQGVRLALLTAVASSTSARMTTSASPTTRL